MGAIQAWIADQLQSGGLRLIGPLEAVHLRPWSAVVRAPIEDGFAFFKACTPALGWEPALTSRLAAVYPALLPDLLGADHARGWLLMRDSGTPLRALIRAEQSLERWRAIMPIYAGLQQRLAAQASSLLELGLFNRRLETLPCLLDDLLADLDSLQVGLPDGLTPAEVERLNSVRGQFA